MPLNKKCQQLLFQMAFTTLLLQMSFSITFSVVIYNFLWHSKIIGPSPVQLVFLKFPPKNFSLDGVPPSTQLSWFQHSSHQAELDSLNWHLYFVITSVKFLENANTTLLQLSKLMKSHCLILMIHFDSSSALFCSFMQGCAMLLHTQPSLCWNQDVKVAVKCWHD